MASALLDALQLGESLPKGVLCVRWEALPLASALHGAMNLQAVLYLLRSHAFQVLPVLDEAGVVSSLYGEGAENEVSFADVTISTRFVSFTVLPFVTPVVTGEVCPCHGTAVSGVPVLLTRDGRQHAHEGDRCAAVPLFLPFFLFPRKTKLGGKLGLKPLRGS